MNSLNYEKLGYVPKKLYHFTLTSNLENIFEENILKADRFGYVYLTETLEDAEIFANGYANIRGKDIKEFSIIEINTDDTDIDLENIYLSTDHNQEYFPVTKSIAYDGDLEIFEFKEYNFK